MGYDVELVTEYAKDMVWEGREEILEEQLYVFAKQRRRGAKLKGKVDWVIVDSPTIIGIVYIKPGSFTSLEPLMVETWRSFHNDNFVIQRGDCAYQQNEPEPPPYRRTCQ